MTWKNINGTQTSAKAADVAKLFASEVTTVWHYIEIRLLLLLLNAW